MATKERSRSRRAIAAPKNDVSYAEIQRQANAARRRYAAEREAGRVARGASYDAIRRRVVIEMSSGYSIGVPVSSLRELRRATDRQLSRVIIDELGSGLIWPDLDIAISVIGILIEILGERTLMAAAGTAGGRVASETKAVAARANGKRGGRPRAARKTAT